MCTNRTVRCQTVSWFITRIQLFRYWLYSCRFFLRLSYFALFALIKYIYSIDKRIRVCRIKLLNNCAPSAVLSSLWHSIINLHAEQGYYEASRMCECFPTCAKFVFIPTTYFFFIICLIRKLIFLSLRNVKHTINSLFALEWIWIGETYQYRISNLHNTLAYYVCMKCKRHENNKNIDH